MIVPYGKYLLVQVIDPPKKKHVLIMVDEEVDPIARCELIDYGNDTDIDVSDKFLLLFRRYELRDCVDKEHKVYLIKEESLLGYEEKDGSADSKNSKRNF